MIARVPLRRLSVPLAGLALAVAGCGGGDGPRTDLKTPRTDTRPATPTPAAGTVDPAAARVIRAWAGTLRRGDVAGAARYFALPSLVSNGTPPLQLKSRAAVRDWNRRLPCGAKVIKLAPAAHGFVLATFRLTERPGAGSCGSGTGGTARTAMRIRKGHITDWLRVPDEQPAPGSTTRS
jgi:hypothetical protein